MNNLKDQIIEKILKYDKISVFVHVRPDPDALGSALSLINFIKINFKQKEIKLIGVESIEKNKVNNYFLDNLNTNNIEYNDEYLTSSLGIILDTPNQDRILTGNNIKCIENIIIDHHPKLNKFCDIEMIDSSKSSTCEMVAELLKYWNLNFNASCAKFLYFGLITDTNRFLYPSTSSQTYLIASWLCSYEFNKQKIHNILYLKSVNDFNIEKKLYKKVKFSNSIAYLTIKNKNISSTKIDLLSIFKEIKIWTSIFYDFEKKMWFGSIRSRDIVINKIAQKYDGGGHIYAAGFKLKSKKEFKNVINDLNKILIENEQNFS